MGLLARVAYIIAEGMAMALIITAFFQLFASFPEHYKSVPAMMFLGILILVVANELRRRPKKEEKEE